MSDMIPKSHPQNGLSGNIEDGKDETELNSICSRLSRQVMVSEDLVENLLSTMDKLCETPRAPIDKESKNESNCILGKLNYAIKRLSQTNNSLGLLSEHLERVI